MTVVRARGGRLFALGSNPQTLGSPFRQTRSQGARGCLGQTREHLGPGAQACDFGHATQPSKNTASALNPGTRQKFRRAGFRPLRGGPSPNASVVGSGTRMVGAVIGRSLSIDPPPRRSR